MRFIFEDSREDILSRLFQDSYTKEFVDEHFIYTNGHGGLVSEVESALKSGEENIGVYIDVVPDNINTAIVYKKLVRIQYKNRGVFVIPIPCSEYYVIKLLSAYGIIGDTEEARIAINRQYFKGSDLICTDEERRKIKNFEKYCKLVLVKLPYDCAKPSDSIDGDGTISTMRHKLFYTGDCLCSGPKHNCEARSLRQKSAGLLSMYELFPAGSMVEGATKLDYEGIYEIHKELVDEYNDMVRRYRSANPGGVYEYIKYMKHWD